MCDLEVGDPVINVNVIHQPSPVVVRNSEDTSADCWESEKIRKVRLYPVQVLRRTFKVSDSVIRVIPFRTSVIVPDSLTDDRLHRLRDTLQQLAVVNADHTQSLQSELTDC
jgi:hypothetical protein